MVVFRTSQTFSPSLLQSYIAVSEQIRPGDVSAGAFKDDHDQTAGADEECMCSRRLPGALIISCSVKSVEISIKIKAMFPTEYT